MRNPLVEEVDRELNQIGMRTAKLIHDSYNPYSFGDAEAVYELGNLKLRIVRDRSIDMVQIGSSNSLQDFHYFNHVAVWMGWIDVDDHENDYIPKKFKEPRQSPYFSLRTELNLIKKDFEKLDKAFSPPNLAITQAQLSNWSSNLRRMLRLRLSQ